MQLHLYDTLSRSKVPFVPGDPHRVTLYVCGPTVYSYAHVGNARPVVVFDVLFRLLRRLYGAGSVRYARNITDVDDKISRAARSEDVPIEVVSTRFAEIYHKDMAALGTLAPTVEPRATAHIPEMIAAIEELIAAGAAYVAADHVLFRVSAFPGYGRLSGRSLDEMIAGARVEVAPYKEAPADFVLWKPSTAGEPAWDSPWGPGRPGWHIECSAMSAKELGLPFDIHGGGHDLIFPHHENELAQACAAGPDRAYARYWMHNGMLDLSGTKMSKSLGNVQTVHGLLDRYPGEVIRLALLKAHFRSPLEWSEDLLGQARKELDYLYGVLRRAKVEPPEAKEIAAADVGRALGPLLDDLNTPLALSQLHALAGEIEGGSRAGPARAELLALAQVLGLLGEDPDRWFEGDATSAFRERVEALLAARSAARAAKDWTAADRIRGELDALDIAVMDSADGVTWRRKTPS